METRLGAFALDEAARELRRGDRLVHLTPKAIDLLIILARMHPQAVSKADLHRQLWPHTFVSDGSLAVLVAEIRRATGDSAHDPKLVRTVSRFGYALVAAGAPRPSAAVPGDRPEIACTLTWGDHHLRMAKGEHVLGRDPDVDILVDAVGVSRRHAAIVVGDDGAMLRDLESKNGTFVNGVRVSAPVRLLDNAEIRLGVLNLRFHWRGTMVPTQTLAGAGDREGSR